MSSSSIRIQPRRLPSSRRRRSSFRSAGRLSRAISSEDDRRAEGGQTAECAGGGHQRGPRDAERRQRKPDEEHDAGSAPGDIPITSRSLAADEVDPRDSEPGRQVAAHDQRCHSGGQQTTIGRGDRRDAEQDSVDGAVEPGTEPAHLPARAGGHAVGDVREAGREHG